MGSLAFIFKERSFLDIGVADLSIEDIVKIIGGFQLLKRANIPKIP